MVRISLSVGKAVRIGDITVTVTEIRGDRVRFTVDAPPGVTLHPREAIDLLAKAFRSRPSPRTAPTQHDDWW